MSARKDVTARDAQVCELCTRGAEVLVTSQRLRMDDAPLCRSHAEDVYRKDSRALGVKVK